LAEDHLKQGLNKDAGKKLLKEKTAPLTELFDPRKGDRFSNITNNVPPELLPLFKAFQQSFYSLLLVEKDNIADLQKQSAAAVAVAQNISQESAKYLQSVRPQPSAKAAAVSPPALPKKANRILPALPVDPALLDPSFLEIDCDIALEYLGQKDFGLGVVEVHKMFMEEKIKSEQIIKVLISKTPPSPILHGMLSMIDPNQGDQPLPDVLSQLTETSEGLSKSLEILGLLRHQLELYDKTGLGIDERCNLLMEQLLSREAASISPVSSMLSSKSPEPSSSRSDESSASAHSPVVKSESLTQLRISTGNFYGKFSVHPLRKSLQQKPISELPVAFLNDVSPLFADIFNALAKIQDFALAPADVVVGEYKALVPFIQNEKGDFSKALETMLDFFQQAKLTITPEHVSVLESACEKLARSSSPARAPASAAASAAVASPPSRQL